MYKSPGECRREGERAFGRGRYAHNNPYEQFGDYQEEQHHRDWRQGFRDAERRDEVRQAEREAKEREHQRRQYEEETRRLEAEREHYERIEAQRQEEEEGAEAQGPEVAES